MNGTGKAEWHTVRWSEKQGARVTAKAQQTLSSPRLMNGMGKAEWCNLSRIANVIYVFEGRNSVFLLTPQGGAGNRQQA